MRNSSAMKGGFLSPEKNENNNKTNKVTTEKDKKFNMTTIMPVSLKMVSNCIRDSVDDTLVIDGSKIDHLSICGRIIQIKEESNRAIVTIGDETDSLSFYIYGKSKSEMPLYYQQSDWKTNSYIKAIILVTNYQDKKIFVCQQMTEVKNFNEVTLHILSIIQTHLHRTRGFLKSHEETQHANKENVHEGSEIKPNYRKSDFSARPNDLKIKEIIDSSSPPNEKVLEICKLLVEKNSNLLLTTDEIMKVTRGRMDEKTISNAIKYMVNNGFMFTSGVGYKLLD